MKEVHPSTHKGKLRNIKEKIDYPRLTSFYMLAVPFNYKDS